MSACMHRTRLAAACVPLALVAAANGQILSDGDFEALSVGTPPDCAAPAGAWAFPANYVTAGVCEALATEAEIVTDPTGRGNSLHYNHNNAGTNVHLPNIFNQVINEEPGLIVSVQFDVWIATAGIAGGSLYVGGDHGGGGFSNGTDRGPQISWLANGTIIYSPGNVVVVEDYSSDVWQKVQMDIDLFNDSFDMSWSEGKDPLKEVGTDLPFRSGTQDFLDRFTYVHFFGLESPAVSFLDDIVIELLGGKTCQYKLKRDAKGKRGCKACPAKGDLIGSEDACEITKDCPKKIKLKKMDCLEGKGFCKKIKGKRSR